MRFIEKLIELFLRLNRIQRRKKIREHVDEDEKDESSLERVKLDDKEPETEVPDIGDSALPSAFLDDALEEEVREIREKILVLRQKIKESPAPPVKRTYLSQNGKKGSGLLQIGERVEEVRHQIDIFKKKDRSEMICFIMYDIASNKVRTSISDYLEEKGLIRVQKSIFMGQLKRKTYRELENALRTIQSSYENEDSIFFVPVAEDEIRSMKIIGQGFDVNVALNRGNTLFF